MTLPYDTFSMEHSCDRAYRFHAWHSYMIHIRVKVRLYVSLSLTSSGCFEFQVLSSLPFKMAEAPRSSFLSGYDEEFVTEVVDDYQCLICCLPLREPVLTRCGHRYCKECLEEYLRRFALL